MGHRRLFRGWQNWACYGFYFNKQADNRNSNGELEKLMKQYLGDAVYADIDNGMIKLTTEDGLTASNTIYLESQVVDAFLKYLQQLKDVAK